MVPLLELMAHKAMKPRHWKRITELTGHTFDIESENFTLRNILQAPLLENKEEIEVRGEESPIYRGQGSLGKLGEECGVVVNLCSRCR